MKKIITLALTLVLSAGLLFGCGSNGGNTGTNNGTNNGGTGTSDNGGKTETPAAATTFDTSIFKVSVPAGWTAVGYPDVFSSTEGATDPEYVYVIKGGSTAADIFNCPYVLVHYAPNKTMMQVDFSTLYDDYKELPAKSIGAYNWEGFSFVSARYPMSMFSTVIGDGYAQVTIGNPPESANLVTIDDPDVAAILNGFAPD